MPKFTINTLEESVIDATAYPILTEEIGFPPSPVSRPTSGLSSTGGTGGLGLIAASAVADVLGWKTNAADPKGFVGALTQAFTLTEIEGRVESTWNPRTYTVQSDLAGGITGAQASLYARATDARDQCLQLLDGLYPLNPDADPEYVKALREMAKSQIVEIVKQFAVVPPSILRVNTYFHILLGGEKKKSSQVPDPSVDPCDPDALFIKTEIEANPDRLRGTLGHLRDVYGIGFQKCHEDKFGIKELVNNPFSNSVEDEQDITNFRVISDYMTSLFQSWITNRRFFQLSLNKAPAFLGTQLILISRQFNVVAETVNEVRFALDSVFIGPNERQQLLLEFTNPDLPAIYLEDLLRETEAFVIEEGPRLIRDGGRIAVHHNLQPVVTSLITMIDQARTPANQTSLPDGFSTPRVQRTLDDLHAQLDQLEILASQVGMRIPSTKFIG